MNTERRHELETNALAEGITTWSDKARPYTSALLGLIAALLGLFIVASLWNSYQERRNREAWHELEVGLLEGDIESRNLRLIADREDLQGTDMTEWAYMSWADRQLLRASQLYLTDREDAKKRLDEIESIYEQFADSASSPELKNRARLGLARVSEMQGDVTDAVAQYELIDGAFAPLAEDRIKALKAKPAKETVEWLATVELPKRTPPGGPGSPGARPGFEAAPPSADQGGVNFETTQSLEEILGGINAAEDAGKRYTEGAAPAEGAAAPAAETPAAGTTEAPATEEKPAAEPAATTPAAETPAADAPAAAETPAESPAADGAVAEKPAAQ
ncbi:hypothetical protein [Lacipirellula parvula]|uniref:Tetratricopeptide repeat-like domain-containing protein n=1 Tax=Lacipirellula parvula TaxID=2650471 RepID=A0A5K7X7Z1_9BACT|nr:hypothetical protein [Lacipirellula parvula]BBO32894.1 hypothetical protein PLANPX_2506 [Lacipirellula parvula]